MIQNKSQMDFYPTRMGTDSKIIPRTDSVVYGESFVSLSEDNAKFFEKNGYLIFENLFSENEVKSLFDELKKISSDKSKKDSPQFILEETDKEVRSVFEIHKQSKMYDRLCRDRRVLGVASQLLGSQVYLHQSRVNLKPGFDGKEFYWHSDFETWHSEDGMPNMRALSCSISLTDNFEFNGPLMVIPGSHKQFVSCSGKTPQKHYQQSLKRQEVGTPDKAILEAMVREGGIVTAKGKAGSAIFFDCNIMHGSNGNITPYPRSNAFFVYNSVKNKLTDPFCGLTPRPEYIASRDFTPLEPVKNFLAS
ncbi:MAG: ectoine hydroxylase [Nitrosopumilaceae archaeon]|jgi:ectoine hydroxylase